MPISQVTFVWTGWSGAPGYTSFYVDTGDVADAQLVANAGRAFFQAIRGELPTEVTIQCRGDFRVMDAATGNLVGINVLTTTPAAVTGAGNATFAAPSGCTVNWLTNSPAAHRLRTGRTYLVPLGSNAYQNDGTLVEADKAALQAAAAAFVTACTTHLVIWKRPISGAGGLAAAVVGARINDRVAMLRSRRS